MAFENIECINPSAHVKAIPEDGVRVAARALKKKGGDGVTRYIRVTIGAALARQLSLTGDEHGLMVLFGRDNDAGKIKLSVDNTAGKFRAKRAKGGSYAFTINAATAEGLFALEFETFDRPHLEAVKPEAGGPRHTVFMASRGMLEVED